MDLAVFDTGLTADCFEAGPASSRGDRYVAVGTYQYFPEDSERKGLLYLLTVDQDGGLLERERQNMEGILDMRWIGQQLVCSTSSGSIRFFNREGDSLTPSEIVEIDSSAIALSLDAAHGQIVTSFNNGNAALIDSSSYEVKEEWKAHNCEVWCAAIDRHDPNLAFTGSDDYTFALWDIRSEPQKIAKSTYHTAGVCVIASDPHREHIFATGSYDESCAFWDRRSLKSPVGIFKVESGVWRLKWHPNKVESLLAACMHDGFQVWNTTDLSSVELVAKRPTISIAYGCDWIIRDTLTDLCGGATFYNHEAIIWKA